MIREIIPPFVAAVETRGDMTNAALLPEEARALGDAWTIRRRDFTLGRSCARRAAAELGLSPSPILIGSHREPLWPTGVVGSITHCTGYCAAVVGQKERLLAIGIDAETNAALPDGVLDAITIEEERQWLPARWQGDKVHWDRVLFSAKESVYKAWFTIAGSWLGFKDVLLSLDPGRGIFHARFLVAGPIVNCQAISCFDGRFLVKDGLIVTAVVLDAAP